MARQRRQHRAGIPVAVFTAAGREYERHWVKVVQRIPLRVKIDTSDKTKPPLRSGMSAEVSVHTGHKRGLPHFLTALFG